MDNKTLELFNYEGALKFPSMTGFSLLDLTEHTNSNGEDFWVDLFESLLNGYGMFLEYIIFSKRNKKLLSFFNKKQEYYPNLCVEKIKEYLKYCNHNIQLKEEFIIAEDEKYDKSKRFSVFSLEPNRQLIEINCSEFNEEIWFSAYIKECTDISLIDDFSPAIIIADKDVVFLNLEYYPKAQLIERIKKVAKKHNKTLEVNI